MAQLWRLPRFVILHAARDLGDVTASTAPSAGGTTRLVDDLREFPATWTPTGQRTLTIDRGTPAHLIPVDRVMVAGGNLYDRGPVLTVEGGGSAGSPVWVLQDFVGGEEARATSAPGLADFELSAALQDRHLRVTMEDGPDAGRSIGELYFGQTLQPLGGVIGPRWEDEPEENTFRQETEAGRSFVLERGEPRRRFTLRHSALSGADLAIYQQIVDGAQLGARPFWFEPPSTGNAGATYINFTDFTDFTFVNFTGADTTGSDAGGGGAVQGTTDGTATLHRIQALTSPHFATPQDWRDVVLAVDVQVDDVSWLTADGDAGIELISTDSRFTLYNFGTIAGQFAVDKWVRFFFDPSTPSAAQGAVLTSSSQGPVDLSAVIQAEFLFTPDAATRIVKLDSLRVYPKRELPVLVELVEFRQRADSGVPRSAEGVTWEISLTMREVLG